MKNGKDILPGFLACGIIAAAATVLGNLVPAAGAASFAILLGIVLGNTVLDRPCFASGSKFSESRLLEYSIVLMGATLNLKDVFSVGGQGILFIVLQLSLTIFLAYRIGKRLGFSKRFSLLMCAGNAVCGSSAIASVSPVIRADSKDKGLSVTIVNVTGTVLMVFLPLLSGLMYHHETMYTSAMIGGTLQSIGQVIASAKFVNEDVVQLATVFKIIRIVFLVGVALSFSRMNLEEGQPLFRSGASAQTAVKARVPWFILGFFALCLIGSFHLIPGAASQAAQTVSGKLEIIALAAIGMRVKFKDLVREGPKAMLYGGLVGISQIVLALSLIRLLLQP